MLARRGYRVPALQQAAWFGGLALMGVALLSPLDSLGETDLLSAHMAQHLLIADLSAPLLVIGLRSPVYAFLLPRSLFAAVARSRLRAVFAFLRQPWIAAPIWVLTLYGWHLAPGLRGGPALPGAPRPPAPDVHRRVAAGMGLGARAGAAARAGRAVEDRPHRRDQIRRHVPGHGVRDPADP